MGILWSEAKTVWMTTIKKVIHTKIILTEIDYQKIARKETAIGTATNGT